MYRRCTLGLCAIALVTIPAFPNGSLAQGKSHSDHLIGTWIYVSSTGKRDDGSTVPRPSLQGAVTFNVRTDAPKYASSDSARPSPDEAMAIASGSIAYTGTYTVDKDTKTIHANIETSTFRNLVGAPNQRRIITSITADEMKFTNPRTPAGVTLEFVWKRPRYDFEPDPEREKKTPYPPANPGLAAAQRRAGRRRDRPVALPAVARRLVEAR